MAPGAMKTWGRRLNRASHSLSSNLLAISQSAGRLTRGQRDERQHRDPPLSYKHPYAHAAWLAENLTIRGSSLSVFGCQNDFCQEPPGCPPRVPPRVPRARLSVQVQ